MQHGATGADMDQALSACIQCGACDLLCPEQIDLSGMIAAALQQAEAPAAVADAAEPDWFAMSRTPALRQRLRADDLYIIDAVCFHAGHTLRAPHYDQLRRQTGCSMNLDLNRMAVATGIGSRAESLQAFDVNRQLEWLLLGRRFQRVIVENPADQRMLAQMTGKPVLSVSALINLPESGANRSETEHA